MQRLSGFYNLKKVKRRATKIVFTDAVELAYDNHVEILDCSKSWKTTYK